MHRSIRRCCTQRLFFFPHKVWKIPLKEKFTDLNRHTIILDSPNGTESLNPSYVVPTCSHMLKHIDIFKKDRPSPAEAIKNFYKLPSIEPAIRHLHGAAGFPTKATWLSSIRNRSYLSCPLVNIKMSTSISQSQKKPKKGTWAPNDKACDSPRSTAPPSPLLQRKQNPLNNPYNYPF